MASNLVIWLLKAALKEAEEETPSSRRYPVLAKGAGVNGIGIGVTRRVMPSLTGAEFKNGEPKKYVLVTLLGKSPRDDVAVSCTCEDFVHRKAYEGNACKHMLKHNINGWRP